MAEYLTTAALHKKLNPQNAALLTERKFYSFMAVGIPTTDTTPT